HPLRDDYVDLGGRKDDVLDAAPEAGDDAVKTVVEDVLARLVDDGRVVDGEDFGSAGLGAEHAEDAGATADVEDDLAREEVLVAVDEVAVGVGTNRVLEHSLMDVLCRQPHRLHVTTMEGITYRCEHMTQSSTPSHPS